MIYINIQWTIDSLTPWVKMAGFPDSSMFSISSSDVVRPAGIHKRKLLIILLFRLAVFEHKDTPV